MDKRQLLSLLLGTSLVVGTIQDQVFAIEETDRSSSMEEDTAFESTQEDYDFSGEIEKINDLIDKLPDPETLTFADASRLDPAMQQISDSIAAIPEDRQAQIHLDRYLAVCTALAGEQGEPMPAMQVFVKTLTGKHITCEIEPSNTIADLKSVIQGQTGIDVNLQNLGFPPYYSLDDRKPLTYYSIQKDTTLHLSKVEESCPYVDASGNPMDPVNAIVLSGTVSQGRKIGIPGQTTWYIVKNSVQFERYVKFIGTVNLILADGAALNAYMAGTTGEPGDSLIIWGQENQTGTFNATGEDWEAGLQIPNGSLVVNGGIINATATGSVGVNGGIGEAFKSITINGGVLTATATMGPAIGNPNSSSPIVITGGHVILNTPAPHHGLHVSDTGSITVTGGTIENADKTPVTVVGGKVNVNGDCFPNGVVINKDVPEWQEAVYNWDDGYFKCTAVRQSSTNPVYEVTETVETDREVIQSASCTQPEITTYTAEFKYPLFETQKKEVETAPASGHAWGSPTYSWAEDNKTVTATRVCRKDKSHIETETVKTTSKVVQEQTTSLPELTDYTAIFNNPAFARQVKTKVVTKPALSDSLYVKMNRLYNPNSGEHFYTANTAEKDYLVSLGWVYEGNGWNAPEKSSSPVYRLYTPNAGDHHYTMNANERDMLVKLGWKYEGIAWYSDDEKAVPLYRQYNPNAKSGSHNYTSSKEENNYLVSIGWKAEGIAWYGLK